MLLVEQEAPNEPMEIVAAPGIVEDGIANDRTGEIVEAENLDDGLRMLEMDDDDDYSFGLDEIVVEDAANQQASAVLPNDGWLPRLR